MMQVRIETIQEKKLIGKRMSMTFVNNTTGELWRSFMPRRNEVQGKTGTDFISMQIYSPGFFDNFNPHKEFEKWAAVEVTDFNNGPEGMETFILTGGLYAVFHYIGSSSNAEQAFRYIFQTWLPNSNYVLDNRPHFEILGEKFNKDSPDSEEEIWIPIKSK